MTSAPYRGTITDKSYFLKLAQGFLAKIPDFICLVAIVLISIKAFVDFDMTWDNLNYHLPFAGLRGHLFSQSDYRMNSFINLYWESFPPFFYYLKGWLWRLTGRPETPQLLAIFSVILLCAYVRWIFKLRFSWVFLGIMSIPVVQVAIVSNYTDVPGNAFMMILVLSVCDSFIYPDKFNIRKLLIMVAAALCASFIKAQMSIQVGLLIFIYAIAVLLTIRSQTGPGINTLIRSRPIFSSFLFLIFLLIIFSNQLRCWIELGSPIYPVPLIIGGKTIFQGPFSAVSDGPQYSINYFQPFRWLLSILEYRTFDFRPLAYTMDQGDVPAASMSNRAGGFMGISVLVTSWIFIIAVSRRWDSSAKTLAAALAIMTIVIPLIPASHQLRYYMYWMELAIIATLILTANHPKLEREGSFYKGFLFCTFVWVGCVTGWQYIIPNFQSAAYIVEASGIDKKLEDVVQTNDIICVTNGAPITFLYAPVFHPKLAAEHPYTVIEAEHDGRCPDQSKAIPR